MGAKDWKQSFESMNRAIVLLITMLGFVPCREVMTYYHI